MAKKIYKIKNFSGGLNSFQTPSDISESQVSDAKSIMFTKQGSIEPSYIMTDTTNNKISAYNNATIAGVENGYGLGYFASDYSATNTATVAIDTSPAGDGCFQTLVSGNYEIDAINAGIAVNLASSFSVGSKVVLSNLTGDSETPFISEEGVYLIIAHNGNNIILDRWLTINLETSQSRWQATWVGIESTDEFLLLSNPNDHNIDIYSKLDTAWTNDAIVLRPEEQPGLSSKVKYYKDEDQIRICDTANNSYCQIRWYGFIERTHFNASGLNASSTNPILGYFSKNNILAPPSSYTISNGGIVSVFPSASGFSFDIASDSTVDGVIPSGVYEFAQTFIYDGNQESLPNKSSSTYTVISDNDLKAFSLNIGLEGDYDERISGGRIYIREEKSTDEWILLADIDLQRGCRTNLSEEYTDFEYNTGDKFYCPTSSSSDNFIIDELNIVNYEILNGYPSSVFTNYIGEYGEKWSDSVVANNRVFICNVSIKDSEQGVSQSSAVLKHYKDRIMYSMKGRLDTFPSFNYIEASKGDPDHYKAIESFADRLFAFKKFSVDIINIASPDDYNWFVEDSKKYMGIENSELVKKTQYGLVWGNSNGLYLYDGSKISNLTDGIIGDNDWSSHVGMNSSIIYDEQTSMVFIIKNTTNSGDAYMCDLRKNIFTFISNFAPVPITNSVDTEDGQTLIGYDAGSSIDIYQLYRDYQATSPILWQSKEIDFGDPNVNKRFYAMYMTYKTSTDLSAKIWYSLNGGSTWTVMSGTNTTGTSAWIKGKWTPSSTISVSKIMFKIDIPSTDAKLWINDIGLEYREIHKRMA